MLKYNRLLNILILLIAQAVLVNAAYSCNTIMLVSSNSHFGMVHRIEAALYAQTRLEPKPVHITAENIPSPTFLGLQEKSCLIVTIGTESLAKILKTNTHLPVLSVLSRKKPFEMLLRENNRQINDPLHPISVIYLDQPLARQLNFVTCLLPALDNTVGVLLGSNLGGEQAILQNLARKRNLKLMTLNVNSFENPVAVLDGLLDDVDIVLALPDIRIYNRKTTRGMLLTAFHKRLPIIGYSRAYVNNGALGAVYATTKQLADQTARQIIAILDDKQRKLPLPQYPKEFEVAINYQVAHTLGLEVNNEVAIKQTMEKMENHANG